MKKLITTFLKDVKLSFNGLYFYIEIGMAIIFVLVMLFVVPENFEQERTFHMHLDLQETTRNTFLDEFLGNDDNLVMYDDFDDLKLALEADRSAVGVSIAMNDDSKMQYEIVLQGFESDRMKKLLENVFLGQVLINLTDFESNTSIEILDENPTKLSDRKNILPIYLTMNVALMGLFIIASYIFLDKDEGVIKAYAVAPVSIWQYLASKVMIMSVLGISTSLFVSLSLVGLQMNYLHLIVMVFVFNLFGSALGLLVASFFDTMTKAMGGLYFVIMIMVFASVSYFMPSFNPLWIKWLPSYPMLFSFRELLLSDTNLTYIYSNVILFLCLGVLLFALANIRFKKTLTV